MCVVENISPRYAADSVLLRSCFCSVEAKLTGGSRALGMAGLGLKKKAQEVLIWYTEECLMK